MEAKKLKDSWTAVMAENKLGRMLIAASVGANLVIALMLMAKPERVVLVPANLGNNASVASNAADENYKTAWALFIAKFLGNITPGNIDFVKTKVGTYMSPEVYGTIREAIEVQADAIRNDGLSVSFSERSVTYEPTTDRVFVTGITRTEDRAGNSESVERTYEMRIAIRNYVPIVTYFDLYRGQPMTEKRLQQRGEEIPTATPEAAKP